MASSSSVSRTMNSHNHIPEEILIDILLRLPSKSLIRFRCACKSWRDLIGSSSFRRSHLNRNVAKRSNSYLIAYHHSSIDEPEHSQHSLLSNETFEPCLKLRHPLWTKQEFKIYGSSNGLVCISDQELHLNCRICIWNPSIGKSRTLPNLETRLPDKFVIKITLSFGFHPQLNDYKVVRMVDQIKSPSKVEVYTLSTDSWKRIGVTPAWFNSASRFFVGSAFSNGIVYWISWKGLNDTIVLFDTVSEEFQQVMVPADDIACKSRVLLRIEPCKESICLLYNYLELEGRRLIIDLWMMKQQSLEKLHTITSPWEGELFYWPQGFGIGNELLLVSGHRYTDERGVVINQMSLYNLESKQFKKTGIELADIDYKSYFFTYIESLVLLDGQVDRLTSRNSSRILYN